MKKYKIIEVIEDTIQRLEKVFVDNKKVIAAFYCGSCATGTYDQYSDIDLVLILRDRDQKKFFQNAPKILKKTVGLKSAVNEAAEDKEWCCLITDYYIGLDLPIFKKRDLKPSYKFAKIRILKDHKNFLSGFKKKSAAQKVYFNTKKFVNDIEDIKADSLYTARHIKKGRFAEVMSNLTLVGEELFHWLVKLKGVKYQPETLRDAEELLSEKELNMLFKSRPRSTAIKDIKKATVALWRFVQYVIKVYEKKFGKDFPKTYDNEEFLELVNDVSSGRKF